jgi:hypothetical protein
MASADAVSQETRQGAQPRSLDGIADTAPISHSNSRLSTIPWIATGLHLRDDEKNRRIDVEME